MASPAAATRRVRGVDLRVQRVRQGLRQQDIADRMGVSRRWVAAIEATYRPAAAVTARYLDALREAAR